MQRNKILAAIMALFVLLFLYTGINKIFNYQQFSNEVKQSPVLKLFPALPVWWIPALELSLVFLLLIPRYRLGALYTCFILMVLFTAYLVFLTYFSDYIPCSCGGFLEQIPPNIHILLNTCLSMLALAGIYLEKRIKRTAKEIPVSRLK